MNQNKNENPNLKLFAEEISSIIGCKIVLDHIHAVSEGRFYYIQAPEAGSPMILNHYRGPFFIDIHPDDLEKITSGEVSPHEYITTANWQIGYFWGGGSMIGGGYYQPFDIVNHPDEVRRYFKILSCRGNRRASGYIPDEKRCTACSVENCPFSNYKNGSWENEMNEYDPRKSFFDALCNQFENQFPGYSFKGFLCTKNENLDETTVTLTPNGHYLDDEPFTFIAFASENVIRDLMMRKVVPHDWTEYAKGFVFKLHTMLSNEYLEATEENIKAIFADVDYVAKRKEEETLPDPEVTEILAPNDEDDGIIAKLCRFFKKLF